jgi:hypothetical protein
MTEKAQCHMFWNSDYFISDKLRSTIITFEKSDVVNVNSDMYHVVLYEQTENKITMNIVCKLLDSRVYVENLMKTMKNIVGYVCNKYDNSNKQVDEFVSIIIQKIQEEKDLLAKVENKKNDTVH